MEEAKVLVARLIPQTLEQAVKEIEEISKRLKHLEDEMLRIKQGRRWV